MSKDSRDFIFFIFSLNQLVIDSVSSHVVFVVNITRHLPDVQSLTIDLILPDHTLYALATPISPTFAPGHLSYNLLVASLIREIRFTLSFGTAGTATAGRIMPVNGVYASWNTSGDPTWPMVSTQDTQSYALQEGYNAFGIYDTLDGECQL